MKKFLLALFCLLTTLSLASAADPADYSLSLSNIGSSLSGSGYTSVSTKDNGITYSGRLSKQTSTELGLSKKGGSGNWLAVTANTDGVIITKIVVKGATTGSSTPKALNVYKNSSAYSISSNSVSAPDGTSAGTVVLSQNQTTNDTEIEINDVAFLVCNLATSGTIKFRSIDVYYKAADPEPGVAKPVFSITPDPAVPQPAGTSVSVTATLDGEDISADNIAIDPTILDFTNEKKSIDVTVMADDAAGQTCTEVYTYTWAKAPAAIFSEGKLGDLITITADGADSMLVEVKSIDNQVDKLYEVNGSTCNMTLLSLSDQTLNVTVVTSKAGYDDNESKHTYTLTQSTGTTGYSENTYVLVESMPADLVSERKFVVIYNNGAYSKIMGKYDNKKFLGTDISIDDSGVIDLSSLTALPSEETTPGYTPIRFEQSGDYYKIYQANETASEKYLSASDDTDIYMKTAAEAKVASVSFDSNKLVAIKFDPTDSHSRELSYHLTNSVFRHYASGAALPQLWGQMKIVGAEAKEQTLTASVENDIEKGAFVKFYSNAQGAKLFYSINKTPIDFLTMTPMPEAGVKIHESCEVYVLSVADGYLTAESTFELNVISPSITMPVSFKGQYTYTVVTEKSTIKEPEWVSYEYTYENNGEKITAKEYAWANYYYLFGATNDGIVYAMKRDHSSVEVATIREQFGRDCLLNQEAEKDMAAYAMIGNQSGKYAMFIPGMLNTWKPLTEPDVQYIAAAKEQWLAAGTYLHYNDFHPNTPAPARREAGAATGMPEYLTVNADGISFSDGHRIVFDAQTLKFVCSCQDSDPDPQNVVLAASLKTENNSGLNTGVESVIATDETLPVEWYTLQGVRLAAEPTAAGIYIRRQGAKAVKVLRR